jgi:hypothetical protein
VVYYSYLNYIFTLDVPWLGKCGVLFLLELYIYFGFPLARLKWRILLKSVRLPLQVRHLWNIRPALCPNRGSAKAYTGFGFAALGLRQGRPTKAD